MPRGHTLEFEKTTGLFVCKIGVKLGGRKFIGNYPAWEGAALAYDREAIKVNKPCNFTLAEFEERLAGCRQEILTSTEKEAAVAYNIKIKLLDGKNAILNNIE